MASLPLPPYLNASSGGLLRLASSLLSLLLAAVEIDEETGCLDCSCCLITTHQCNPSSPYFVATTDKVKGFRKYNWVPGLLVLAGIVLRAKGLMVRREVDIQGAIWKLVSHGLPSALATWGKKGIRKIMTGQWTRWLRFEHRPSLSAFISFSASGMSITHIPSMSGTAVHHVCGIWSTNARTKLWFHVVSDRGCLFV